MPKMREEFPAAPAQHIGATIRKRPKQRASADKIAAFRKAMRDVDGNEERLPEALQVLSKHPATTDSDGQPVPRPAASALKDRGVKFGLAAAALNIAIAVAPLLLEAAALDRSLAASPSTRVNVSQARSIIAHSA
jgi:hypothetical protein